MHTCGVLLVAAELCHLCTQSSKSVSVSWPDCMQAVNNFREATRVVSQALPSSIPAGHVLLRLAFAGVNASDVNFSSGRYHASVEQAQASLPFDAGFEAVGAVAAVGPQVSGTAVVAPTQHACFLFLSGVMQCRPKSHRKPSLFTKMYLSATSSSCWGASAPFACSPVRQVKICVALSNAGYCISSDVDRLASSSLNWSPLHFNFCK